MERDGRVRRFVAAAFVLVLSVLVAYRINRPVPGMPIVLALLLGATVVLWILQNATTPRELRKIREERQRLDAYTAVVTMLVAGLMAFILTYLAAYLHMIIVYTQRQSGMFAQFLFELLQRIRLFELFHVVPLTALFVLTVIVLTAGVLVVYPAIPIRQQRLATTVTFLLSWIYGFSLLYLIEPIIHPLTPESLVIDAVLVTIWANLFYHLYQEFPEA